MDARNRAVLAVAYDALLRRSELTALQVADLVVEIHGGATLLVRCGKSDPEGRGAAVYLARRRAEQCGPAGRGAGRGGGGRNEMHDHVHRSDG